MANPDWYTGSDTTGRVASGIEDVIQRMDAHTADGSDIERIGELLEIEQEINWRCFLVGLLGTIHYDLEQLDTALELLEEVVAETRVYLDSFDDVLNVYCQSCYTVGCILVEQERHAEAVSFFLRCVPHMHEVYDEVYVGNILSNLQVAYARSNQAEPAAAFAEAAVFARGGDCRSLEELMVCYTRVGDIERASEILHLLEAECEEYEHIDRVRDFARRHLGVTGAVN